MRGGLGYEVSIVIYHKPADVFPITLSVELLSELKMLMSFFVKSVEKFESHSYPIERRLALFKFGHAWDCVAVDGNIGRGRYP